LIRRSAENEIVIAVCSHVVTLLVSQYYVIEEPSQDITGQIDDVSIIITDKICCLCRGVISCAYIEIIDFRMIVARYLTFPLEGQVLKLGDIA
jgi:hypothetical protein